MSKIIDYEKKGNIVRFYLGKDDCEDYHGDDWDDAPYDCNAGKVYNEYEIGHTDIVFPFDYTVLEPCEDWRATNCRWCKDDMKQRMVPCIVAINVNNPYVDFEDCFNDVLSNDKCVKFYFGDSLELCDNTIIYEQSPN